MTVAASSTSYELCIVGAGIAGLNAAFVAGRHLDPGARVLLLDRHDQPGGMWNDAYSYVRLHQPYSFFTAGNIPWNLAADRAYLARGDEVQAHLRDCLQHISQHLDVDARWGWEYLSRVEEPTGVTIRARDREGQEHTFTAGRMVLASGFDVSVEPPLTLSSTRVRSTAPHLLASAGPLASDDDAPAWVIGSGKTAMDTVQALVAAGSSRDVVLVAGSGTYFFDRDTLYPTGIRRWWGGTPASVMYAQAVRRFDGTNSAEVARWARGRYTTSPVHEPTHNVGAMLSGAEAGVVRSRVSRVLRDHLADVEDTRDGPVMALRSGARVPVPEGSWIVNCTGFLGPREVTHEPYVSSGGRVLSINLTSTTTGVSGTAGYFLTHLLFLGKLSTVPLYALNWHELRRRAPEAVPWVRGSLLTYNLGLISDHLPPSAYRDYGLDTDRWFPRYRRMLRRMRSTGDREQARRHCRRSLDEFARTTGVPCAPVETVDASPVRPRAPAEEPTR
ncbi:FAD-dependent oxidoreductase [Nocardioides sp. LML1-1-1.1]|uniref:FAD-dependent oxidoreductase n=1 Tax=Nocardioides sp. LML1-1-1.1 TaxID=3135248 RepID=UPI003419F993